MHALRAHNTDCYLHSKILHKILDKGCNIGYVDKLGMTALIYAFCYYGSTPMYDSSVLNRLLDMNCVPEQVSYFDTTALMYCFEIYGKNPGRDPAVILKLILLVNKDITSTQLSELMNNYTRDEYLKDKIAIEYNYYKKKPIVFFRVSRRFNMRADINYDKREATIKFRKLRRKIMKRR